SAGRCGQSSFAVRRALAGPDGVVTAGSPADELWRDARLLFLLLDASRGTAQRLEPGAARAHIVFPRNRATQLSQPRKEIATPSSAMIMINAVTAAKKVAPARSQAKRIARTVHAVRAMRFAW